MFGKKQRAYTEFSGYPTSTVIISGVKFNLKVFERSGGSISAHIKKDTMIIRIPKTFNHKKKIENIERIKGKLSKKLEKLGKDQLMAMQFPELIFKEGKTYALLGDNYSVLVKPLLNKTVNPRGRLNGNVLEIYLPENIKENKEYIISKIAKKLFYIAITEKASILLDEINKNFYNFHYNKLRIHEQQRLWGSYSRKTRNILLNMKLFFAPDDVIKYVMAHELSHIHVSGHTEEFWNTVAISCPNHKELRRWLRKNGNTLGINDGANQS